MLTMLCAATQDQARTLAHAMQVTTGSGKCARRALTTHTVLPRQRCCRTVWQMLGTLGLAKMCRHVRLALTSRLRCQAMFARSAILTCTPMRRRRWPAPRVLPTRRLGVQQALLQLLLVLLRQDTRARMELLLLRVGRTHTRMPQEMPGARAAAAWM